MTGYTIEAYKMFHTDLVDANGEAWHDTPITPALSMNHSYNHCLDTLCWSDSIADKAYKIAICGNSLQHIRINRYCRYLVLPIPVWKTCVCAKEYGMTGIKMPIHLSDIRFPTEYIPADYP